MQVLEFDGNRKRVKYCPCGESNKNGKFKPFVGYDQYGYCFSCGDSFFPEDLALKRTTLVDETPSPPIPKSYLTESLTDWDKNNLITYLKGIMPNDIISTTIKQYRIGTNHHKWSGASVLWYIDRHKIIRAGKVTLYDPVTGKRIKTYQAGTTWIHKLRPMPEGYRLTSCFYGEHLTSDRTRKIAVVEAERTAIVMSAIKPELIWIASGGKQGLSGDKFKVLKDREVILFPDSGDGYKLWKSKADDLQSIAKSIKIDESVQSKANGRNNLDLLDLMDIRGAFRLKNQPMKEVPSMTDDDRHRVRMIFPDFGDVLNQKELLNAILYHRRKFKSDNEGNLMKSSYEERMRPHTLDQINDAESIMNHLIECGAIIRTEAGYFHAYDYSLPAFELTGDSFRIKPNENKVWDIDGIRTAFQGFTIPESITMDDAILIDNVPKFIESHLKVIEGNNGNPSYQPYLDRLLKLKAVLSES